MPDHVIVHFGDVLECSDPVWAKNQYSPEKVYELDRVIAVSRGEDRVTLHLQFVEHKTWRSISLPSKLCDACRTSILWNRIESFQNRLDDIEARLDSI